MWAESSFERALFAGKMHYRLNLATGEAEHIKFFTRNCTRSDSERYALCILQNNFMGITGTRRDNDKIFPPEFKEYMHNVEWYLYSV